MLSTYDSKHLKSSIINLVRSFIAPASRLCFAAPIGLPCGTTLLCFDRSPWQRVMASNYLKYMGRVSPALTTFEQLLGPCKLHLYLQYIQDVNCLQPLCALVLHNVLIGLVVDCAVLEKRQSSTPLFAAFPSLTQTSVLTTSDSTGGVTLVTQVVAVTSFLGSSGTPSSTATPDPSDDNEIITKVVRVGPTTVNTANCNPLLCTVNVAVSDSLPLTPSSSKF